MVLIKSRMGLFLCLLLLLAGCSEREILAPVEELKWQPFSLHQKTYRVKKGDTLYAVAFRFDKDYRELAAINRLQSPYLLHAGQSLHLQSPARHPNKGHRKKPSARERSIPKAKPQASRPDTTARASWIWPVNGRITTSFRPEQGKKGINIAGKEGDKIRASADGVIAYSGNGLSGYGNLIIIKHQSEYLTAYGNNGKNLVREGQRVKAGQIIADMGVIDRQYWGLHFEIRKRGKPVNPLNFLQKKA